SQSAALHEAHDLEAIARLQLDLAELRAAQHLAVLLHRHRARIEGERREQVEQTLARDELARLAVDDDLSRARRRHSSCLTSLLPTRLVAETITAAMPPGSVGTATSTLSSPSSSVVPWLSTTC